MISGRCGAILLVAGAFFSPPPAFGQVEGTYTFVVCEAECASTDTIGALAAGELVLFPDSTFADAPNPTIVEEVDRASRNGLAVVLASGATSGICRLRRNSRL